MKNRKHAFSVFARVLCVVLIAAMALTFTACGKTTAPASSAPVTDATTVVGQGSIAFTLQVVDADGNETDFTVNTDEKTVGDALQKAQLIDGTVGEYGLYVTTVNGITADWDKDQTYWAFYINGEYAMTGVSDTPVEQGAIYALKISK